MVRAVQSVEISEITEQVVRNKKYERISKLQIKYTQIRWNRSINSMEISDMLDCNFILF